MRNGYLALLFLCSCSLMTPTHTDIDTKPALNLPNPSPIRMGKVQFVVVSKNNAESVFSDMEAAGKEPVLFALSASDYKILASNTLQLKTYIKHQQKIIRLYREYYEDSQNGKSKNK